MTIKFKQLVEGFKPKTEEVQQIEEHVEIVEEETVEAQPQRTYATFNQWLNEACGKMKKEDKIEVHDGDDDGKRLGEETDDQHYSKQTPKMQDAINLHLRKGKSYKDAVAAAQKHVKEEVEDINELKKSTLGSYVKKSSKSAADLAQSGLDKFNDRKLVAAKKDFDKSDRRQKGVEKAVDKLTKEEVEDIEEGQVVKTKTGIIHKGTYGSEYDTDEEGNEKKKEAPAVKRGRGRPKKGSDETGNVKKYSLHPALAKFGSR